MSSLNCDRCRLCSYNIKRKRCEIEMSILLGRVALVAQRPVVVKLSRGRSVGPYVRTYVRLSVRLSSALWKNGGSDPGMRQVVWFGDWSPRRRTFRGEFGARHCNQIVLYGVRVRERSESQCALWYSRCLSVFLSDI